MNISFVLSYPWWFILFCLLAGALAAGLLYYRNTREDFSPALQKVMALFRFVVITLLCFFLLGPLLKMQLTLEQEPIILFFHDNSESITLVTDSALVFSEYTQAADEIIDNLSQEYTVNTYAFGDRVREFDAYSFNDQTTDISEIFESVKSFYSNRNVGGIIIASDGIFNRGSNPIYAGTGSLIPVYTLALGDTLPQRDLIINRLSHNRITYLNNLFPVELVVEAREAAGMRSRLRIWHKEEVVFEQNMSFTSDAHFETVNAQLEAYEVGMKRYRVEVDPVDGEVTLMNNTREFFIEVIDSRQKVLILAAAPHPDVGALKQTLEDNENFETRVSLLRDFDQELRDYNLVIWHQIPATGINARELLNQASREGMAQLFILGAQSNISEFNTLQTGIQIQQRSQGFNDSRAEPNNTFSLFQITSDISRQLPLWPPLNTPFANYNLAPGSQIMAHQKIGDVVTDYPLIIFSEIGDRKTAVISGEGIWRWRLNNFAREENHNAFNDLTSRIVQYLSVVEDRSFFRLNVQNFFTENQPVIFEAELYNRSYELVNDPEVNLIITNEEGVTFDYIFGKTPNAYRLSAGTFPVGEYSYKANTQLGNEQYSAEGIFTVSPLNLEGLNTQADHNLLYRLAANSGGEMFYPENWQELVSAIKQREDIKPVLYTQNEFEDLINLRWIFFLLLLLLSAEWFIRKYSGSY